MDDRQETFAFPSPAADHPAARIDLDPAAHALRKTLDDDSAPRKHHRSLGNHRTPHLKISRHHRRRSADSSPEAGDAAAPGKSVGGFIGDTALLKVPKTYSPHARSLDTTTTGRKANGVESERREKDKGKEEVVKEPVARSEVSVVSGDGYESPMTPTPVDVSDSTPDNQTVTKQSSTKVKELSVFEQVRQERDEKPGVTPAYLTNLLTTLQSLTRSHALKLSTASRTIEHRVAEWAILSDKMQELDREAAQVGLALVGKTEWSRRLHLDTTEDASETEEETPLKVLEHLVIATQRSTESLTALSDAVDARADDVRRLRDKVEADSVVLERRMGRGLERKMEGIERAQRDAKRRDLVINVVTFTVLFLVGIALSRLVFKLSTGMWSIVSVKEWAETWVGVVRGLV